MFSPVFVIEFEVDKRVILCFRTSFSKLAPGPSWWRWGHSGILAVIGYLTFTASLLRLPGGIRGTVGIFAVVPLRGTTGFLLGVPLDFSKGYLLSKQVRDFREILMIIGPIPVSAG